jgi:hypothetical protein
VVQEMHIEKIKDLFQEIDEERTGIITYQTFQRKMNSPEVRSWLVVLRHLFFLISTTLEGKFSPRFLRVSLRQGTYFETLDLDVWDAWSFFKLLDLDEGKWKRNSLSMP